MKVKHVLPVKFTLVLPVKWAKARQANPFLNFQPNVSVSAISVSVSKSVSVSSISVSVFAVYTAILGYAIGAQTAVSKSLTAQMKSESSTFVTDRLYQAFHF